MTFRVTRPRLTAAALALGSLAVTGATAGAASASVTGPAAAHAAASDATVLSSPTAR